MSVDEEVGCPELHPALTLLDLISDSIIVVDDDV